MRQNRTLANAVRGNDSGIALPMVLLIFVLSVLLVTAFVTAIVGSAQVTSTTRANIQAQAAADAGIEDALVRIAATEPCAAAQTFTDTNPNYTVKIECNGAKSELIITSEGSDANGDTQTVEAKYLVNPSDPPVTQGGPGMFYTYSVGSRLNSYIYDAARSEIVLDETPGAASVYASTGDITCGYGSVLPSHVYTGSGNAQIDHGCVIKGNAYIGGTMNLNGGQVHGDVISPSSTKHTISGTVGTESSGGNVILGGTINLNGGTVNGSVIAAGTGENTIGSHSIAGNYTYTGSNATWGASISSIVDGSVTKDTSLTAPELPQIPEWQNVTFNPVDATTPPEGWADAGFSLVTVPSSQCSQWNGNNGDSPIWPRLSTVTTPTVYDVRACSGISTNNGLTVANKTVNLKTDIGIISKKAVLTGLTFTSANDQTMWFVTPDPSPTIAAPNCGPGLGEYTIRQNTFGDKVAIYLYTPCQVNFNTAGEWRGQVYSGDLKFGGGVTIAFAPRSVPGYDFSDGSADGEGSGSLNPTATLGALAYQRNIDG